MAGKLDGKVAIVTGAGSSGPGLGTGKATSVLLAREGASVVLVDKFEERAKETLEMIEADGGEATIVVGDLAEAPTTGRVVDEAVATYGRLDILVNNAAIPASVSLLDTTDDEWQRFLAINLSAPFLLCRAAIPVMIENGGGSIVNISSVAALRGNGGTGCSAYAATKAGLEGLMIDIADAYGGKGIRINCVAPGLIATPMRDEAVRSKGGDPSKLDLTYKTSLGIEGDGWDIARAVLFLAGPDGRYITGVMLPVDGGAVARSH
jgi:NAD(P)-dependent dehydrogenase (short-subunit alcohol dehydrogenase family)